jgi:beta-lactamase regulating signal transducer with metallopeptidase domain
MKTATSLTVIAIGAILAFAVTASPSFLNVQTVGWILMVTGAIGVAASRDNRQWVRRRVIVRGPPEVARTSRRRPTAQRRPSAQRRPPARRRQLVSAQTAAAAPAPAVAEPEVVIPPAQASPTAPTEEFEPVTIEEFTEQ